MWGWMVEEVWEILRRRNNSKEMKDSQPQVGIFGRVGERWDGDKHYLSIEPFTWGHGTLDCEP